MASYTLNELLDVLEEHISDWYSVTFVNTSGVELHICIEGDTNDILNLGCYRPGDKWDTKVVWHDEDNLWRQVIEEDLGLLLNSQCWNVHKDTLDSIDSFIDMAEFIKNEWAKYYKDENGEKNT